MIGRFGEIDAVHIKTDLESTSSLDKLWMLNLLEEDADLCCIRQFFRHRLVDVEHPLETVQEGMT